MRLWHGYLRRRSGLLAYDRPFMVWSPGQDRQVDRSPTAVGLSMKGHQADHGALIRCGGRIRPASLAVPLMALLVSLSIATSSAGAAAGSFGPAMPLSGAGTLYSVSCSEAEDCTAVGYSPAEPVYATGSGGVWGPVTGIASPGGFGSFRGVSCVAPGDCTAVGNATSTNMIYAVESSGTWGPVHELADPSYIFGVSCVAAGDCTAVGADEAHGGLEPGYVTESEGTWAR